MDRCGCSIGNRRFTVSHETIADVFIDEYIDALETGELNSSVALVDFMKSGSFVCASIHLGHFTFNIPGSLGDILPCCFITR